MEGFTAFKLWVAMGKHFSENKFNIFENRGKIKCRYETYLKRKDYYTFERLAKTFEVRDFVLYLASNNMYGNSNMIWDSNSGNINYNLYIRRRDALTYVLTNDLETIKKHNLTCTDYLNVLKLLTVNEITFETLVIINNYFPLTAEVRKLPPATILEPLLLRIDKSKGFVKINEEFEHLIKEQFKDL